MVKYDQHFMNFPLKITATLFRLFDTLLFSSAFITLCAIGMVAQTFQLCHIPSINKAYFLFTAGGTIASYNLHGYFTKINVTELGSKRNAWLQRFHQILMPLSITGLLMAIIAGLQLYHQWFGLIISMVLAFLYTAPKIPIRGNAIFKRLAVAKTTYLALAWTYVTSILPIIVSDHSIDLQSAFFIFHRFFFVYALCIVFDHRDKEADLSEGVHSLITKMDDQMVRKIYFLSLLLAGLAAILFSFLSIHHYLTGLLLCIPIIILALISKMIFRQKNDYVFYFMVDGLMLVSFLLTELSEYVDSVKAQ